LILAYMWMSSFYLELFTKLLVVDYEFCFALTS
jgi:hypothetical protein